MSVPLSTTKLRQLRSRAGFRKDASPEVAKGVASLLKAYQVHNKTGVQNT